ncbi:MAG: iron-containing redox enzyme family protein [Herminiimonas sp.]|nr:iron-containing redox enzyme family protein [Herminiimonas sp.]
MSNLAQAFVPDYTTTKSSCDATAKDLYFALEKRAPAKSDLSIAREFLSRQLAAARVLTVELPEDIDAIADWIALRTEQVGQQYRDYLGERKAGAPRRYFQNKAHALYFLKMAAPTKLVDGSWLYGTLARWHAPEFRPLIQIYLEELGNGVPGKNHVVLYKNLLALHGCDQWRDIDDVHFTQGAIQLSLAFDADHFLPELIGYNLGYEQLPLHLLITSYELNELGIDPYYFTLHVTVDNAATGHAMKALQGLEHLMPRVGDAASFYHRVIDGYRLNDLGANTTSIIAEFDLEAELVDILRTKSVAGQNMHSDYCRVGGRTVNDWLSQPRQIPAFLKSLESTGWIKRGEAPENSRFWRLIQSERAEMFGVFSSYEQQVLQDWIWSMPAALAQENRAGHLAPRVPSFRAQQRALDTSSPAAQNIERSGPMRGMVRHRFAGDEEGRQGFGADLRLLEQEIALPGNKNDAMNTIIPLMSPTAHHTAAGLMATRVFIKLLG